MNQQTENSKKVYATAKACLGENLSGNNPVLGCAKTVNNIFLKALGSPIGGDYSTNLMFKSLQDKTRFDVITTENALPGDVIISPTGYGNGRMPNGHVGIVGVYGILSNNSEDGELHENYTVQTWVHIYQGVGGFPALFFRVK